MCLPKVVFIDQIETHYYLYEDTGELLETQQPTVYYPERNEIHVLYPHPNLFKGLLHDIIHWVICLLPKCEAVYKLNNWYDHMWTWLFENVVIDNV